MAFHGHPSGIGVDGATDRWSNWDLVIQWVMVPKRKKWRMEMIDEAAKHSRELFQSGFY